MNIFQAANGAATFLILSAIVAGLAKRLDAVQDDPLTYIISNLAIVYLGLFIIVFRIKTLLDDHRHFGESHQDKSGFRYVGFILAIISWLFGGLAAYLLPTTVRSSELMATSLLVSTLWIAVHVIEILVDSTRRNKEVLTSPLFTVGFRETLAAAGVQVVRLPPRSPNLNAFAERFVRTIKESCLDRMILIGEASLRRAVAEFIEHYHRERNHQGLGNQLIVPLPAHRIDDSRDSHS